MLVLSRKKNESIIIGDNIEVVIVDVKGEQVKVGIKAPRNVTVHRAEVYEEIQRENEKAAKASKEKIAGLGNLFKKLKK